MTPRQPRPDLSLIMPCYDEEDSIGFTVPRLIGAFRAAGYELQLVAVDNGSRDRTAERLADLASRHPELTIEHVSQNVGYGHGILRGIPRCSAPWIGTVAADGQVDAEDLVRLYEAVSATTTPVLGKVRRRFRMDGLARKVVSVTYNSLIHALWPSLGSWDVNGQPRLLPRDVLLDMQLERTDWCLDLEMLIKSHYMGVRILELNVFARMRGNGLSHVRVATCWEFLRQIVAFRFAGVPPHLKGYRKRRLSAAVAKHAPV